MPQDLACEEGVAVGLPMQRVGKGDAGLLQGVAGRRFHQGDDLGVAEAAEVDTLHVLVPVECRQHVGEWMLGAQVARSVGADHQEPVRIGRRDHVPQQQQ